MTTTEKIARRKLAARSCVRTLQCVPGLQGDGLSRQQFYEIRRNYQTYGAEGLIDRLPGRGGHTPTGWQPRSRQPFSTMPLPILPWLDAGGAGVQAQGHAVSSGGVRGVWQRHNLLTKHERLLRLEKTTAERKIELKDEQIRLLERFSPEFRERHIEAPHTGALVAVDTFFVGALKGVGKVYLQTAIDCHSRYAWARLYPSKLPLTAVHTMNNDVLPSFEEHDAKIEAVFSDNGREFCGRPDQHPYELFLQLEDIEHRTTRVKRPSPTASSSACIAPCSTSTSVSKAGEPGSRPLTRCRLRSMTISSLTTPGVRIKAVA